jgi:hypothetical protein
MKKIFFYIILTVDFNYFYTGAGAAGQEPLG